MSPTVEVPLFKQVGQACWTAKNDARAVTKALEMSKEGVVYLSRSFQLCTLVQVDVNRTRFVPVGRSYENNAWEPYMTNLLVVPPTFSCDPVTCQVKLPPLLPGHSYELVGYHYTVPKRDEIARFLEQATFGPTRNALDQFPSSFGHWIKDQQDVVPPSLHREFYRARLNARIDVPSTIGLPTQPCDGGARYRRFAFTELDQEIDIRTDSATGRKVLYVDNQARTVLETKKLTVRERGIETEVADGMYVYHSINRLCAAAVYNSFLTPNIFVLFLFT